MSSITENNNNTASAANTASIKNQTAIQAKAQNHDRPDQDFEPPAIKSASNISLTPLPESKPLLLIGHGTRDENGRQTFLDFAAAYQECDRSRPVVPCFLELTEPTIMAGVEQCIAQGYDDMTAMPLLLFAARHSKFDVTAELDRIQAKYPQVNFRYGRHLGITANMIQLWRDRLAQLDSLAANPRQISREDTVILVVGRGSSDPDANSDVCKLARILWEGSGYKNVEVCFIGITHPRLEEGFRRAMFYAPKRIIVLPHFLFTGALIKKIATITQQMREQYISTDNPSEGSLLEITGLDEIGIDPKLFTMVRDREIEAQQGQVQMNCQMCKFRMAAIGSSGNGHSHDHHSHNHNHHDHGHSHDHHPGHSHHHHDPQAGHSHNAGHDHGIAWQDIYQEPEAYHDRAWQVP
ncbi:Sirohydrochlorin ferrochelatase [Thalassoporum mexicanum PCC 7367]|uniref:sirohydrochlorin chelatase n=1 Tax=Thalassoporum mexicanum TaxID=3457544 RepID=UPI00029FD0FD|nr:sirohydrochlorin chelatase [Pseudanabaena sp. PCC 7367]AFY68682.1 Sirohydrochlorin ferrochelatase [Pseudanabaena sp. PCC 7367]